MLKAKVTVEVEALFVSDATKQKFVANLETAVRSFVSGEFERGGINGVCVMVDAAEKGRVVS